MSSITSRTEDFFERRARQGDLKLPTVIVVLTGIVFGLQHVGTYYSLSEEREVFVSTFSVLYFAQLLEPLLLWVCFTIAFYIIAQLFGAEILIGRLFRLIGWGFLPLILSGLVWTAGRYLVFSSATIPDFDQGVLEQEMNAYGEMVAQNGEPLIAVFLVGCVFLIPAGFFWVHAMKKSGTITTRAALISVIVPTVAYVILRAQHIYPM